MSGHIESNKAKIACRVIEVLEFFDEDHPEATVMDIVRRYNRPQSSTSELLSSLVELGLLYKDAAARSYSPTPRAAMLAAAAQPAMIRNGQLTAMIDRLTAQTGLGVGVFGMVGPKAQIVTWRSTPQSPRAGTVGFGGGLLDLLTGSAAGWLLLSTVAQPRRDGILRRLNAEAPAEGKFVHADMAAAVDQCRDRGFAIGPAGFGSTAQLCAILLPGQSENRSIAIGFVYEPSDQIDPLALVDCLRDAVRRAAEGDLAEERFYTAA
jgi:DNA-binding IclR family transcriptional regulator